MGRGANERNWAHWSREEDRRLVTLMAQFKADGLLRTDAWVRVGQIMSRSYWSVRSRFRWVGMTDAQRTAWQAKSLARLAASNTGAPRRERYLRSKARQEEEITLTLEQALARKRDIAARLAEEDARIASDTRTAAQVLMGEPHPDRSALREYKARMVLCTHVKEDP